MPPPGIGFHSFGMNPTDTALMKPAFVILKILSAKELISGGMNSMSPISFSFWTNTLLARPIGGCVGSCANKQTGFRMKSRTSQPSGSILSPTSINGVIGKREPYDALDQHLRIRLGFLRHWRCCRFATSRLATEFGRREKLSRACSSGVRAVVLMNGAFAVIFHSAFRVEVAATPWCDNLVQSCPCRANNVRFLHQALCGHESRRCAAHFLNLVCAPPAARDELSHMLYVFMRSLNECGIRIRALRARKQGV